MDIETQYSLEMNRFVFWLVIGCTFVTVLSVATLTTAVDCPSSQVYAKITKKTASYANEESFTISDGATVVFTSPSLVNSDVRVLEVCLQPSTNSQYSLEMKDSYGDSWSNGAWIEIEAVSYTHLHHLLMRLLR